MLSRSCLMSSRSASRSRVPGSRSHVPGSGSQVPASCSHIPASSSHIRAPCSHVPRSLSHAPASCPRIPPHVLTFLSHVIMSLPHAILSPPHAIVSRPSGSCPLVSCVPFTCSRLIPSCSCLMLSRRRLPFSGWGGGWEDGIWESDRVTLWRCVLTQGITPMRRRLRSPIACILEAVRCASPSTRVNPEKTRDEHSPRVAH
jgi:hypothetical protein